MQKNLILRTTFILVIVCNFIFAYSSDRKETLTSDNFQSTDTLQIIAESESLFKKGKLFYDKEGYAAAIDYFLKSDSAISVHFGTDCPYFGYGNMWVSCCYHKLGMDSLASEYDDCFEAQPIDKLLTHSSDSIVWIGLKFEKNGQKRMAADKLFEAATLEKKEIGPNSYWYANTLSYCARLYNETGWYEKAYELCKDAVEINKKVFGTSHPSYLSSLSLFAGCNSYLGNYAEALRLATEVLEIRKNVLGIGHTDYAIALDNLANYNSELGNYTEAIRLGTEAMEIIKENYGTEHPDYALSLNNLSGYNSNFGNYAEAIRLANDALEIWKNVFGKLHPDYATTLGNLANYYSDLGNYAESIRLDKEAMKIWKTLLGPEDPEYARSLNNLGQSYSYLGNYAEAIRLETEAMGIAKRVFGTEHPVYATLLGNLALINSNYGDYAEAVRLETEAMGIRKKVFGINHPEYALSLKNLANYNSDFGNYAEAYKYCQQNTRIIQSHIRKIFSGLSSTLQKSIWERKYADDFNFILPNCVVRFQTDESISELYDMTSLFAKGILLNTGIEMRKLILESGDSIMIQKYDAMSKSISIYNKLIEKPQSDRYLDADSLNSVIQKQEMEIARDSKAYGDYTHNMTIKWKDVQRNLGDNDIAIEFLDFPIINTDSTLYVAITLKRGYDSPRMVTLFEKKQLMAIPEDIYYTQTDVSNLVWKPLKEELKGIRNIYFAPSGELHRIGIEYLPINGTNIISDKHSLYRLTSTRQLAIVGDRTVGNKNILYGGINYDEKTDVAMSNETSTMGTGFRGACSRVCVDSLSTRGSFEYLDGTRIETNLIAENMELHRAPYIYYIGKDATEESFKQLDGTKPKAMHIATHGFYYTEAETKKSQFARHEIELVTDGYPNTGRFIEDKSMTRSGLLFSGCNRAFRHEQIPEGEEDGILTAQEISTLDLRGLDLVVLSACQTGLGDVISGEGVFGLQRGFKKAGAKTLLMSLNKVDDEATRILMVEFYRNLMDGKTKHQSLKEAQKHLREVEKGKYDDPKYWASFIMLDGID